MFTIEKINSFFDGVIHGDKYKAIKKISEFKSADEYSVVFIKNKLDMKYIKESKAGLIIGPKDMLNINKDKNYINRAFDALNRNNEFYHLGVYHDDVVFPKDVLEEDLNILANLMMH